MLHSPIKKFILKFSLFCLPFILLIGSFLILDPFRVIHYYPDFNGSFVTLNPDYISTTIYLRNREKYRYNSFLFGNSKTLAYKSYDWTPYLEKKASPFVYHASFESLYGIWLKVKFIDEHNDSIKNAIIIMDQTELQQTGNYYHHLNMKDPRISHEGWLGFYSVYFNAFLTDFFFISYIDYYFTHQLKPFMANHIDQSETLYDPVTNDMFPMKKINDRAKNFSNYYEKIKPFFYVRDNIVKYADESVIKKTQLMMLNEIKEIFIKHHSNYKIILGPLYNQSKLNPKDLQALYLVFGTENVYDFSGINTYTKDIHNFYEVSHYTIEVGKDILKTIYTKNDGIR